ncbi:PEP-CTERM sorting domain-containing protein [Pseudoduganella danionis]|uniref:PEP-CTERM sorting domain-containing protein n=1 Tax=Pseudoduganella danionis TaxID=1890295 RepID=UPI001E2D6F55|nr:PEP-CTERM sorting domain-containing protein [Pseudoduganella danionis]
MKLIKSASIALALGMTLASGMAAADTTTCSGSSIEVIVGGHSVPVSCLGYYSGNLNGNSHTWQTVSNDLTSWGVTLSGPVAASSMVSSLSGAANFHFSQTLYGETIIGIHYGIVDVTTNLGTTSYNNQTAFYKFNAGTTGVSNIINHIASISNATVYRTGVMTPVPEPETYAMLLAGLGMVGLIARRRKQA